jgi:hypothetical protein
MLPSQQRRERNKYEYGTTDDEHTPQLDTE